MAFVARFQAGDSIVVYAEALSGSILERLLCWNRVSLAMAEDLDPILLFYIRSVSMWVNNSKRP